MKGKAIYCALLFLLSGCLWAQGHDHSAMQNSQVELTGDDVPDFDAQRLVLIAVADNASDNETTKAAKKAFQRMLGYDDDKAVAALNRWARANQAASDKFNAKAQNLLSPNGGGDFASLKGLEKALGDQQQKALDVLSADLFAAGANGDSYKFYAASHKKQMTKHVSEAALQSALEAVPHLENVNFSLKKAIYGTTTYQSGYTTGWLATMDNTYVYGITTLVGHYAYPTWTCTWDQYHQQWQPYPGCTCAGAGVPCHTPTLTTYIGSSYTTYTWPGQSPSYDWNVSMGNQNTLANSGTMSFAAQVWCTGAAAWYVNAQYGGGGAFITGDVRIKMELNGSKSTDWYGRSVCNTPIAYWMVPARQPRSMNLLHCIPTRCPRPILTLVSTMVQSTIRRRLSALTSVMVWGGIATTPQKWIAQ